MSPPGGAGTGVAAEMATAYPGYSKSTPSVAGGGTTGDAGTMAASEALGESPERTGIVDSSGAAAVGAWRDGKLSDVIHSSSAGAVKRVGEGGNTEAVGG